MCGINGFNSPDAALIGKMNAAIRHRGPDFAGVHMDGEVSLGHVLLSIRSDPGLSRQPFHEEGSPWWLLFNGQLYNTAQIKAELGPELRDEELDTRLLYRMIRKHGWGFAPKVHGMWAVALYHEGEKSLRLYRDPSGQKPLYYYHKGRTFAFSSEIKGILALSGVDAATDPEGVELAARMGYIPGHKTLFRHIRKVNLSEEVAFDLASGKLTRRYFRAELSGYYSGDAAADFENLVDEHLQSKRKVSINLSGGMDSSLILHEMCKKGFAVDSYTTRFETDDPYYNQDADLAARLSKDYGTAHHELLITRKDFLDVFAEAYRTVEEPNYNNSVPHLYLMFRREGIRGDGHRVLLSGDGGDEVFAGYPHYLLSARLAARAKARGTFLFNLRQFLRRREWVDYGDVSERWLSLRAFGETRLKRSSFDAKGYVRALAGDYIDLYDVRGTEILKTMLVDRAVWLGAENFLRSDKLTMSQSFELRSPLSYMPFREAMDRSVPEEMYHGEDGNKLFLRNLYRGKLPAYITDRKDKTGWRSPTKAWYGKEFRDLFLDILKTADQGESQVDWKALIRDVETAEKWPGKTINLYLSLAILKQSFRLSF